MCVRVRVSTARAERSADFRFALAKIPAVPSEAAQGTRELHSTFHRYSNGLGTTPQTGPSPPAPFGLPLDPSRWLSATLAWALDLTPAFPHICLPHIVEGRRLPPLAARCPVSRPALDAVRPEPVTLPGFLTTRVVDERGTSASKAAHSLLQPPHGPPVTPTRAEAFDALAGRLRTAHGSSRQLTSPCAAHACSRQRSATAHAASTADHRLHA